MKTFLTDDNFFLSLVLPHVLIVFTMMLVMLYPYLE